MSGETINKIALTIIILILALFFAYELNTVWRSNRDMSTFEIEAKSSSDYIVWRTQDFFNPFDLPSCGSNDVWDECKPTINDSEQITFTLSDEYKPQTFSTNLRYARIGQGFDEYEYPGAISWNDDDFGPLSYTMTMDTRVVHLPDDARSEVWGRITFDLDSQAQRPPFNWTCIDFIQDEDGFCLLGHTMRATRILFFPVVYNQLFNYD